MKTKNNGKQADNCKNLKEAKRVIKNIVRNLQKQDFALWEIWEELHDVVDDECHRLRNKQEEEANKPKPAGGYVRARIDGNEVIAVREDGSGIIAYAYTQEAHDEESTFEKLVEYLKDAADLPEGYDTYEDWAGAIEGAGDKYQLLFNFMDDDEWRWICHLAGISSEEYPYGDLAASGCNMAQYMPKAA